MIDTYFSNFKEGKMGYIIRMKFGKRIRSYGTGELGKGKPYKTYRNAKKRAEFLSQVLHKKAKVIKVKD